jgi:hypothetical protein
MPRSAVQHARGTSAQHASITGLSGEFTFNTDTRIIHAHDGITPGGFPADYTVNVHRFGAKGDFNPSTGTGTDDRVAIQSALDFAATVTGGCTVVFPPGKYYLGTGFKSGVYQLLLSSATNIKIEGYDAEIYQGNSGSALGISDCVHCAVLGLRITGYCGGALGSSREHDNLIALLNSKWITIEDCYLTNSLGDCIYIGGNGRCEHVRVVNNTLKERYGNGTRSSAGGSRSRLALAVIDAYDVLISVNTIIGGLDFENNLAATQYLKGISVAGNIFSSGHVTPQNPIGSAYWTDEDVAATGGTVIAQGIQMSGPGFSTATQYSALIVTNNRFEEASLFFNSQVYRVHLKDNHFDKGLITVGDVSGSNTNTGYVIDNNTFDAPITGETCVIKLGGDTFNGRFTNNIAAVDNGYVFGVVAGGSGVGGVDVRSNYFSGNVNTSTNTPLGVFSWGAQPKSVYVGNWYYTAANVERARTHAMEIRKRSVGTWPTVTVTTAAAALDYKDLTSDTFILAQTGAGTLGSIANCPDGAELTVEFDGAGITVVNSGSIRLKGGVNAVATDANSIITLVARAGLLWEKCRNF